MAFSYRVSLQLFHPDANPDGIVAALALNPHRVWRKGDPRSTPSGTALPGKYRETYCVFDLGEGDDGELTDCLRKAVDALQPKSAYLAELRQTGGSMNLYVSWTIGERGEVFDARLLADIADLGIDLGIEPRV